MRRLLTIILAVGLLTAACSGDDEDEATDDSSADGSEDTSTALPDALELRQLHVADGRIVDDLGRDVLLRGANVNSLGEYWQDDPDLPAVVPVEDADWAAMAANGLSVVRLLVSWSALQPEPERVVPEVELDRIDAAVQAANDHGIYVVLDMHQDAWSATLSTPPDTTCPADTEEAIGWDGAPEWATLGQGGDTCTRGARELAPAVQESFSAFYADEEGIRTELAWVWGVLAERFAGRPGIAGYDLLNEPNPIGTPESLAGYSEFLVDATTNIRAAEEEQAAPPTPIFFEPIVVHPLPNTMPDASALPDDQLVFAPHNYAESIGPDLLTIEQTFDVQVADAEAAGAALWVGEYGWWDTSREALEEAARFAAAQDQHRLGGTWWQWRQACGDPHSIGEPGGTPDDQTHLNAVACPSEEDLGPTEEFLAILGRAYPRAAPGVLTTLESDPATGAMTMTGTDAQPDAELVVWVRDRSAPLTEGEVTISGLRDLTLTEVEGGTIVTATTTGAAYSLEVAADPG